MPAPLYCAAKYVLHAASITLSMRAKDTYPLLWGQNSSHWDRVMAVACYIRGSLVFQPRLRGDIIICI